MRPITSTLLAIAMVSLSSACSQPTQKSGSNESPDYEIVKNGIVKEENKHNYEALGDTTFIRTQSYKVRRITKGKEKESRILFLKYVLKVGNKDVSDGIANIFLENGEGELLCAHAYDVKIASYDTTPDPTCTYIALGDTPLSPARVVFR